MFAIEVLLYTLAEVIKVGIVSTEMKTFREACCLNLGIREEDFEKTVLLACLPRWYLPVAYVRWYLTRYYFYSDLELIRQAGNCTTISSIITEINESRYHHPVKGIQRKFLHARLSGNRLIHFASPFLHSK